VASLVASCAEIAAAYPIEFIFVNNGSTDNTGGAIEYHKKDFIGIQSLTIDNNIGYGFGILSGLNLCSGKYIGWTHADLQTDVNDILAIIPIVSALKDTEQIFIKGKRMGRPITDKFFTVGMSIFETITFKRKLWDVNAQPTVFSRILFDSFIEPPKDFSLDLYAYVTATLSNYQVARIPVHFHARQHGKSSWNKGWTSKRKFIRRTIDFTFDLRRTLNANN